MRRAARLSGWPGPAWLFPGAAAAMAAGTFLTTRSVLAAAYPLWADVSSAWHESLWVTGAGVASAAALLACLLCPRQSALDIPTRPKVTMALPLRHGTLLGVWLLLGHAVGLAPIHGAAIVGATYGHLAVADVVAGAAGVILLSILGFSVGAFARTLIVVPVIGLVLFGLMGLPMEPLFRPLGLVLPVRQFTASPRFETSAYTAVFSVLSAIALSLAVAGAVTWSNARGSVRANRSITVAWVGVSIALVAVAFAWRPELYLVDRPVPSTCTVRQGTEICLHDANLPADADVTRTVDALHDAGLSDVLTHVNDGAAVDRDLAEPGEVLIHLDPGPFDSNYYASTLEEQVADQIVTNYTVAGCAGRQDASVQDYDVLRALQHRILQLAGFESLIEGQGPINAAAQKVFARMSPSQVADVIDEHKTEIRSCTLTLADVGA